MNAETFNRLYPVGTPVVAYPGCRPEDDPSARRLVTRTRSEARSVGLDREGVVWVDGHGAFIALTHIDVVTDTEPITDLATAVEVMGALPMPAGPAAPKPRWQQARTELIRTFRDYMPETAATKATDLLDKAIAELGVPASTVEWGVRLVDGGYTATARDREQALENLAGLNAHDQAAVLVSRTVHRSAWTEVK